MASRKTRKKTKTGELQVKKWGPMAKQKNFQSLERNCKKFKKAISANGAEKYPGK